MSKSERHPAVGARERAMDLLLRHAEARERPQIRGGGRRVPKTGTPAPDASRPEPLVRTRPQPPVPQPLDARPREARRKNGSSAAKRARSRRIAFWTACCAVWAARRIRPGFPCCGGTGKRSWGRSWPRWPVRWGTGTTSC